MSRPSSCNSANRHCAILSDDRSRIDRRCFTLAALAAPFALSRPALAASPIYIGDMHVHLFFFGPKPASSQPLGKNMAAGGATLVSWALVGDVPWLTIGAGGFKQKGTPKAGEPDKWFHEELNRIKAHISEQKLKIVQTADDVDRALAGEPHVVLSVEGASFIDDPSALRAAYDLGIRHVQLVHYIRNPLGDFQTERPEHYGLTDLGKAVVAECNRLGILVDLAHSTSKAVADTLAIATAPVVWSHSSVTRGGTPAWTMPVTKARQLSLDDAKAIAAKGGVVGLWALGSDVGRTPADYAGRLIELADWLGDDHVGFGTDMNALSQPAIATFSDSRRVIEILQQRKVGDARIRKLAIENYARVLKDAFAARKA